MRINASIVLYNNDKELLEKVIHSFLDTELKIKLYLIDNSETDKLKYLSTLDDRIEYSFNNENLGFGKAHNIALQKSIDENIKYHLVLNPDVYYNHGVIEELIEYMDKNLDVANVMPKVYYPNGDLQYVCKMLPTPMDLIIRRFIPLSSVVDKINKKFELHSFGYDKEMNVPSVNGCFLFLRTSCLKDVGLFDENIFLYMEDIDLIRRLYMKYRVMFYPHTSIVHVHAQESQKKRSHLILHIKSTIYYFNKWGWFFDTERRKINIELLKRIKDICKSSSTLK